MIGQIRAVSIEEIATPARGFRFHQEADQIKALQQMIDCGYRIRNGRFVKDPRTTY